jgi:hypothetical protein
VIPALFRKAVSLQAAFFRYFGADVWLASYGWLKDFVAMMKDHPQVGRVPPELESLNIAQ